MASMNYTHLLMLLGGGVKAPAARNDILQWLKGVDSDGITILDKVDVVNPQPEVRDVNCLRYAGAESTALGSLSATSEFSASMWFRLDSLGVSSHLIAYGITLLRVVSSTRIDWFPNANGSPAIFTVPTMSVDTWYNLVITQTGTSSTLYIDGVSIGTLPVEVVNTGATVSFIGSYASVEITGYMSQVMFFDKELSSEESIAIYTSGTYDIPSMIQGYSMSEGYDLPNDVSANNTPVLSNSAIWATSDGLPSWTHLNGCTPLLITDGVDDFINTTLSSVGITKVEWRGVNDTTGNSTIANTVGPGSAAIFIATDRTIHANFSGAGDSKSTGTVPNDEIVTSIVDFTAETISINGVTQSLAAGGGLLGNSNPIIQLFSSNSSFFAKGQWEYIKIWNSSGLALDVIPISGGFLDKISGDVYSNAGTGVLPVKYSPSIKGMSQVDIDVVIFAGQSNCEGYPQETIPAKWDSAQAHLFGYNISDNVASEDLIQLVKYSNTSYGAELEAGIEITATGRRICFIKVSDGGSNLYDDWQKGSAKGLYENLQLQVADTLAALELSGYVPTIRQFWWMQGEADSQVQVNADAYLANLNTFTDDLIADGIIPSDVDYAMGHVVVGAGSYTVAVNSAIDSFVASNGGLAIDTSGYDLNVDNVHYTADGLDSFGNDLSAYFISKSYPATSVAVTRGNGTDAEYGQLIANKGGYVHNGSEVTLIQTDADETVFGGICFYTSDAATWDKKTKAQYEAHYLTNGSLNLWVKKSGDNISEAVQYDVTREFTPAENAKNESYFGGTSAALRDVGGDLILDVGGNVIYTA
jgi:hypothetical protein